MPLPALLVAVLAGAAWVLLNRTQWGRWIYAVGGDPEAARRVGIPVDRVLISVYVLCGAAAGIAGLLVAGRTDAGSPNAGQLLELDSITAVIIGGASFFGGRGNVGNVVAGALIIGVIRNGLNLLDVTPFWQSIAIGTLVIVSLELDVLRGQLERRMRVAHGPGAPSGDARCSRSRARPRATARSRRCATPPWRSTRARSSRCSATTAPASRRWSRRSAACTGSTRARSASTAPRVDFRSPAEARARGDRDAAPGPRAVRQPHAPSRTSTSGASCAARAGSAGSGCCATARWSASGTPSSSAWASQPMDARQEVGVMSGGQRQAIALLRAVAFASRLVILDEPTAALGVRESSHVLDLVRRLPEQGVAVLLISHNLEHVSAVADRAVVLRQGRSVGEAVPTAGNHEALVSLIVGAGTTAGASP